MDWILDREPSPRFPVYTRGNVSEVFPDPITPLNATTGFLSNFEDGYRDAFVATGVWSEDIYDGEVRFALMGCLGGYVYINMSYLRVFAVRVPGYTPELLDRSYGVDSNVAPYADEAQDWHIDPERTASVQQWVENEVFGAEDLAPLDAERAEVEQVRAARPDLRALSDAELVARIRSLNPLLRRLFKSHAEMSVKAGFALGVVMDAAERAGTPEVAFELVGGVGDVDSTGPTVLLAGLAEQVRASAELTAAFDAGLAGLLDRLRAAAGDGPSFCAAFDDVCATWGFRGPGEWELRRDTWQTDPALALALIDRLRRSADGLDVRAKMERTAGTRRDAVDRVLQNLPTDDDRSTFRTALAAAHLWVRGRERSRTSGAMGLHEQRLAAHELGRRGAERGVLAEAPQVYMLLEDELDAWVADPAAFTDTLADREQTYRALYDYVPPFMITGPVPDRAQWERAARHQAATASREEILLTGGPGSSGVVRGRARIVHSPHELDELEPGEVLVARITDPSWTPLFLTATAVVTEVGGVFSHGPIVCRELGTPCVVAVTEATQTIPDGAEVEIDGSAGTVRILPGVVAHG